MQRSISACIASAVLLGGCGGLASGGWPGDVLHEVRGSVFVDPGDPAAAWPDDPLRVAVFWAGADGQANTEQAVVVETEFPARYELALHAPPPEEVRFESPWAQTRVAVGMPMLYLDFNGNERWDEASEPLAGGAFELAILYAEDASWEMGFEQGFQTVWLAADVCAPKPPTDTEMFPVPGEPVDLYVGEYWSYVRDWNCDGSLDEWDQACPPESDMLQLCEDPKAMQEPFLQECAWLCP
ncbi:MAG: hypothetical protein EP330_05740 [Deltaproteobacteria bacterium]|nr:MAG: hypothetical protein EP330_05740 [Deltaproteobacteria bacterium]